MKCAKCKGTCFAVDPTNHLKLVPCPTCITIPFDLGYVSFSSDKNPYPIGSDESMEWTVGRFARQAEKWI